MKSRDFCYWLQGFFEIVEADHDGKVLLTEKRTDTIKKHLSMVFKHEIDPSMGNNDHQEELTIIHEDGGSMTIPPGDVVRC